MKKFLLILGIIILVILSPLLLTLVLGTAELLWLYCKAFTGAIAAIGIIIGIIITVKILYKKITK